jgi:hypothetical protein
VTYSNEFLRAIDKGIDRSNAARARPDRVWPTARRHADASAIGEIWTDHCFDLFAGAAKGEGKFLVVVRIDDGVHHVVGPRQAQLVRPRS